jgi:hypothetical protein
MSRISCQEKAHRAVRAIHHRHRRRPTAVAVIAAFTDAIASIIQPLPSTAGGGHLALLQWVWANGCGWNVDTKVLQSGGVGGHLAVLQWARVNGCDWDTATRRAAVRGGHLAMLQWLRTNG